MKSKYLRHNWYLFGFSLVMLWGSFFLKPLDAFAPASFEAFYLAQGFGAAFAAAVFVLKRKDSSFSASFLNWPVAIVMSLAPLVAFYAPEGFNDGLLVLSAVLGGIAWIWFFIQWFFVYSKLDLKSFSYYALLSFAVMPILRLPLEFVSIEYAMPLIAVLPFLIAWTRNKALLVIEGDKGEGARLGPPASPVDATSLVLVVVELSVYGLVMGLFRVNTDTSQGDFGIVVMSLLFKVAFPILLLALVRFTWKRLSVGLVCQVTLVFILGAIALATALRDDPYISYAIFDCMRQALCALLLFALGALATRMKLHPIVLFGLGWAPYALSLAAGMVIADTIGGFAVYSSSFVTALVCILAMSSVFVFGIKGQTDIRFFPDGSSQDVPPLQNFDEIDRRCSLLAERNGLTNRELDVLQLICKGRSKRYIAEHFVLSENTIRSYAKSLYVKLNVHSRQELLDLLERIC